nr:zinc finger, CCHC-type [Tanacetum cinerariifolium]
MRADQDQVDKSKEFLSSNFFMKDMGEADVILGIKIKHEDNGAILRAFKKQTYITDSTMEEKFVALAAAGKEADWLKNLINETLLSLDKRIIPRLSAQVAYRDGIKVHRNL